MYRRVFVVLVFQPGFSFMGFLYQSCVFVSDTLSVQVAYPLDLELWKFCRVKLHICRGYFATQMRLKTRLCLMGIGKNDD